MSVRLEDLGPCFQGVVPGVVATCSRAGEPNISYLSQVQYVDERHVALSCQFFNKTKRNALEHPQAMVIVLDPVTLAAYRLRLRYDHQETEGPLFEAMSLRIQVIASHTGMAGVFRLLSADVYEVLAVEPLEGFLRPIEPSTPSLPGGERRAEVAAPLLPGPKTELRNLQLVSDRIARAADLDGLLTGALAALDERFGFSHAMVLVPDEGGRRLVAIASRGYDAGGVGAEVAVGAGIIGCVAARRRMIRVGGFGAELRYGRAIRGEVARGATGPLAPEIPLPGLPDAQSQLALPLVAGDRLVGVLAVESRDPLCFDEWDESFLGIVANQIALGMDRMDAAAEDDAALPRAGAPSRTSAGPERRCRHFVFYRNDDCVFLDGEYLVRNVPGKILWKILRQHERERRVEFTNRELRLDPSLGLPAVKDNLESRLILLRKRLAEKCPDVRLVPVRRGRFALELESEVELVERESG
jgi:hypothetical protein